MAFGINSKLDSCGTIDRLIDFTGTIAEIFTRDNLLQYRGIIVALYDKSTSVIGTAYFPMHTFVTTKLPIKVYGDSSSVWGTAVSNGSDKITCNRTASTTNRVAIFGVK